MSVYFWVNLFYGCIFLGSILSCDSCLFRITSQRQDLDTIMYFTLLSTQKWSLSRSTTYLVSMIIPSIYCNTKSTLILSADRNQIWRLQVVGNISKSSDQLKSNPSLYFSLRPLYHLSCSSFDFLGIVIVKVCFFPGADFLLNRALDNCRVSVNQRIQFREMQDSTPPVNGVHVRNGTFPLFTSRQIHLW